jgi:DnaJ family protein C protein 19
VILKLLIAFAVAWLGWRLWKGPTKRTRPRSFAPLLDEAEARAVLGVDTEAGEEEIRAAHRRLMVAVHPDRGGSAELARKINVARDTLLRRADPRD